MIEIPEEILLDLKVDEEGVMRQLQNIEEKTKEVDKAVEETDKKSRKTWFLAVGVAQASWGLMDTLITSVGGTVSGVMRATIQGAFSAIAILQPILTATAVTPGMQALAAFGFFQIGLAIAAAAAAETNIGGIEQEIRGYSAGVTDINSWIRSLTAFGKST